MSEYNYYSSQLSLALEKNPVTSLIIRIEGDMFSTKGLGLNPESIKELRVFLDQVEETFDAVQSP